MLSDIKDSRPVFAFDYLSLNSSNLCFNSKLLNGVKEYQRIFESLKTLSSKNYDELSKNRTFHFHEVDFDDTTISESEFVKCLTPNSAKTKSDNIPTVYQFKIFDKARIFGFIYKSVFYLVFLIETTKVMKENN